MESFLHDYLYKVKGRALGLTLLREYWTYLGARLRGSATVRPVQRKVRLHVLSDTPKSYLSQENNGEALMEQTGFVPHLYHVILKLTY